MALIIKIDGTAISNIMERSVRYRNQYDKRRVLSFSFFLDDTSEIPSEGLDVEVYEDTTLRFGGTIRRVIQNPYDPATGADKMMRIDIYSDGYNSLAARRTIDAYYTATTAGAIVTEMITSFLTDEGVTAGTIDTGATIDTYNARYKSISEILDDMAEASGYSWNIDNDKGLDFVEQDTIVYGTEEVDETDPDHDYFDFVFRHDLTTFRNKQFVEGGTDDTGTIVRVNVEDSADIAARALAEGNSGVYGNVFKDSSIQNTTDAEAVANELLFRYKVCNFATFKSFTEYTPGEVINVTFPKYGIATDTKYLITSVESGRTKDGRWVYTVAIEERDLTTYSGKVASDGLDFFLSLARKQNQANVVAEEGDTEVIITQVTNEADYSGFTTEQALDGIDVDFLADTKVSAHASFEITPSVAMTLTVKFRVDGVDYQSRPYPVTATASTIVAACEIEGVEAGTKTVDVTVTPSTDNGTISAGDYQLHLIIADVVSEPPAAEGRLFAATRDSGNQLFELDPDTLLQINNITVTADPFGIGGIENRLYYQTDTMAYEIDPDTLVSINDALITSLNNPRGIGGTSSKLYIIERATPYGVYEIDPDTLAPTSVATAPSTDAYSIGGITDRLYSGDIGTELIYEHDTSTLAVINSATRLNPSGLGGTVADRLYYGDLSDNVYEIDPDTLAIITTVAIGGYRYEGVGGMK